MNWSKIFIALLYGVTLFHMGYKIYVTVSNKQTSESETVNQVDIVYGKTSKNKTCIVAIKGESERYISPFHRYDFKSGTFDEAVASYEDFVNRQLHKKAEEIECFDNIDTDTFKLTSYSRYAAESRMAKMVLTFALKENQKSYCVKKEYTVLINATSDSHSWITVDADCTPDNWPLLWNFINWIISMSFTPVILMLIRKKHKIDLRRFEASRAASPQTNTVPEPEVATEESNYAVLNGNSSGISTGDHPADNAETDQSENSDTSECESTPEIPAVAIDQSEESDTSECNPESTPETPAAATDPSEESDTSEYNPESTPEGSTTPVEEFKASTIENNQNDDFGQIDMDISDDDSYELIN